VTPPVIEIGAQEAFRFDIGAQAAERRHDADIAVHAAQFGEMPFVQSFGAQPFGRRQVHAGRHQPGQEMRSAAPPLR
jgi:hypothetical protein